MGKKAKTIKSVLKLFNAGRKNMKNGAILYTEREKEEFERGFNAGISIKQKEMDEFKIKMGDVMLEHELAVNNSKFNEGIEAAKNEILRLASIEQTLTIDQIEKLKKLNLSS